VKDIPVIGRLMGTCRHLVIIYRGTSPCRNGSYLKNNTNVAARILLCPLSILNLITTPSQALTITFTIFPLTILNDHKRYIYQTRETIFRFALYDRTKSFADGDDGLGAIKAFTKYLWRWTKYVGVLGVLSTLTVEPIINFHRAREDLANMKPTSLPISFVY
jgi:hypothetical protein